MEKSNLQAIAYMLRHDPAVVTGFSLMGLTGFLFFHLQYKVDKAGVKTNYLSLEKWNAQSQYLQIRSRHGWSPWPAYLIVPSFLLGIAALIFGLLHL